MSNAGTHATDHGQNEIRWLWPSEVLDRGRPGDVVISDVVNGLLLLIPKEEVDLIAFLMGMTSDPQSRQHITVIE